MRKIFLALITCVLLFVGNKSQAQLTVTMSTVTVDSSQNASVDVTVAGFTNLAGVTFSVNWDSLVLSYVNVTNFSTSPVALSINNVGPPGQGIIKKGQMTFSWDDPNAMGRNLPNGTRLFTIVFRAIGNKCATTDITTSSTPIKINITYGNFTEDQNLVNVKGKVTIDCDGGTPDPCPNPICANPSNLTFSAPTVSAKPGDNICIPISVRNFNNINSGQGAFTWNPALLRYTGKNVPANGLPEMGNTLNENDSLSGKISFVWVPDNTLPKTLPNGTVIIELCFEVLGAPNSTACILMGQGTPETIWSTEQSSSVPTCYVYGKVNITDVMDPDQPTLIIKTGNVSGKKGDTVCINVTVDSLINGLSFRTEFTWNITQLRFIRTDGYNLQGLTMSMFNNSPSGRLIVAWSNPNPVTLPNGTSVFQICFELLECPITAAINITGVTEGSALINGNPEPIDVVATGGIITITCVDGPSCQLGAVTNVTCNGGSNGSILLSVTGSTADCTCLWKNSAGVVVKAAGPVASGCNLSGVPAGTYTYEVTCGGTLSCSGTATVNQPTPINIPTAGVVTNVGCGQNGSINISNTSGGTGPYTYSWTPNLGNTANPTNLNAGSYTVTVTDANQCTATITSPFVVGDTQGDLIVTVTSTNIICKDAANGTISLTISGGCPTYSIVWSGTFQLNGANPQNVRPGTYTAVVTDGSNPVESRTVSITITEPATSPSIAVTNITGTLISTSNGSITLTITGGTAPYGTQWSGGITPGNTSSVIIASNLSAGSYNVTVTDANGCTATIASPIIVPTIPNTGVAPVATATVTTILNGFNVPCFGNSTAVVRVSISAGTFPITVKLFKGTQEIRSQAVNTPTFDFTGLDAGTYRVEYSNTTATGTPITNIVINQPSRLVATQKVECTEKNGATGTIEISLNNTGTSPYNFNWSGIAENSNRIQDLPADAYNVTVTDANGCTLSVTNIEVRDCSLQGACYEASTIISPNGDNINDFFLINCVLDNPSDLSVFDRWGRVVYSQSNYDNTWQGLDNTGKDLLESSYIWVLTVNFGQGRNEIHKGTVTLLRTR